MIPTRLNLTEEEIDMAVLAGKQIIIQRLQRPVTDTEQIVCKRAKDGAQTIRDAARIAFGIWRQRD